MAQEKTLDDLFLDTLKDIYYAENQIVKTLPKMLSAPVTLRPEGTPGLSVLVARQQLATTERVTVPI